MGALPYLLSAIKAFTPSDNMPPEKYTPNDYKSKPAIELRIDKLPTADFSLDSMDSSFPPQDEYSSETKDILKKIYAENLKNRIDKSADSATSVFYTELTKDVDGQERLLITSYDRGGGDGKLVIELTYSKIADDRKTRIESPDESSTIRISFTMEDDELKIDSEFSEEEMGYLSDILKLFTGGK